jgi:hypothetical protein
MSEKQKKLTWRALFMMAATLLTASLIAAARVKIEEKNAEVGSVRTASVPRVGPVRVVRFALYDVGIYPHEARVQPGLVTISIEDLSGASSGLIIERVEADVRTQVGSVDRLASRLRARAEMLLVAGRYEVSDASRRNNRAWLIVEP